MLGVHSQIHAPNPLHLWRDVVHLADQLNFDGEVSRQYPILVDKIEKSICNHYPKEITDSVLLTLRNSPPHDVHDLINLVYESIRASVGKQVLFIKENRLQFVAAQVISQYPRARFLFQVRDPRDVLASAKKLRKGKWGTKFGSLYNGMRIWKEDQDFGLSMRSYFGPARVRFQRYEDLIADPEEVLRGSCAFLGLDFENTILEFHNDKSNILLSKQGKQWENLAKPVQKNLSEGFGGILSPREIRAIETYLGDYLDKFGYQKTITPGTHPSWLDIQGPKLTHGLELLYNKNSTPFYVSGNQRYITKLQRHAMLIQTDPTAIRDSNSTIERKPDQGLSLSNSLLSSAHQNQKVPSLEVEGVTLNYEQMFLASKYLAQQFIRSKKPNIVVGIYAVRHWSTYVTVLASILSGVTFVPLNPKFPISRNRSIISRARVSVIISTATAADKVSRISVLKEDTADAVNCIFLPDNPFDLPLDSLQIDNFRSTPRSNNPVYLLFTSGTSGTPKGVPISETNLLNYLHNALNYLTVDKNSRFSQTFDLTFDLSIHDLFVCWLSGSTLVVASHMDLLTPARYLKESRITHWFSVPSLAQVMNLQGELTENNFPGLQSALFCGEALPGDLARLWLDAAPKAIVENWYGPTEVTIACTRHRLSSPPPPTTTVPIGLPFDGTLALIIDNQGQIITDEESIGELYLGGPQVAESYWRDKSLSEEAFVTVPGQTGQFYRTGDLAHWRDGILHFSGRTDSQIKIRGFRVELGEIETAVRKILSRGSSAVATVAIAWPPDADPARYIVAAVESTEIDAVDVIRDLRDLLPIYLIPSSIITIPNFPKNVNGKIDRAAVASLLSDSLSRSDRENKEQQNYHSTHADILSVIREINPTISSQQLENAANLLEAGMDSLNFISLTLILEERYGMQLDDESVTILSRRSLAEIEQAIDSGKILPSSHNEPLECKSVKNQSRAHRAIEFIRLFPEILSSKPAELVLAVGSSGLLRGFSPSTLDETLLQRGREITAINIGMPALNCAAITRLAEFIANELLKTKIRPSLIIYELDPMHISPNSPAGDIELPNSIYMGHIPEIDKEQLANEFRWNANSLGEVVFSNESQQKSQSPRWQTTRDQIISDTYAGKYAFDELKFETWMRGLEILAKASAQSICFIHPINSGTNRINLANNEHMDKILLRIREIDGIKIINPDHFSIEASNYLNFNHVTMKGSYELTNQIDNWLVDNHCW